MALTPNLAAKPNGLDPKMARAWAKYFSKWIAGKRRNRRNRRIWRKRLRCPRSNVHHIDDVHISSITGSNSATMITILSSRPCAAYGAKGISIWGVTVQNEPEATAGWEAMLWTPDFMASFVRDHLGPVLEKEQPGAPNMGTNDE